MYFTALLLLALLVPSPAFAYLDMGTGTFVVQMIVAGIAGGLVSLKLFWRELVAKFKRKPTNDSPQTD